MWAFISLYVAPEKPVHVFVVLVRPESARSFFVFIKNIRSGYVLTTSVKTYRKVCFNKFSLRLTLPWIPNEYTYFSHNNLFSFSSSVFCPMQKNLYMLQPFTLEFCLVYRYSWNPSKIKGEATLIPHAELVYFPRAEEKIHNVNTVFIELLGLLHAF